jgi:hypothetical protein
MQRRCFNKNWKRNHYWSSRYLFIDKFCNQERLAGKEKFTSSAFPGGTAALAAHIKKNMVYPEQALQFHVEGTVYGEVTVDSLG